MRRLAMESAAGKRARPNARPGRSRRRRLPRLGIDAEAAHLSVRTAEIDRGCDRPIRPAGATSSAAGGGSLAGAGDRGVDPDQPVGAAVGIRRARISCGAQVDAPSRA
ncbi:hypothetical protein Sdagh_45890 [Streptomyces daghestanicus]|uniref:Uncharacterized protein n=1 Tax=Streptomyces daghestanicus TaxID=66885 RepID=A0ABQ3Q6H2_9ACTN|nr:hypothetical protein Sdagh_45890 [Streptomyces daghestanicus]